MANTTVTVPTTQRDKEDWVVEVSNLIAGGDNVIFVDDAGTNVNVKFLSLNVAKYVAFRPLNRTDDQRVRIQFVAGGWHRQNVHKIFGGAGETETGAEIHVKTE